MNPNDWNNHLPERRLLSWQLRRPSPKVERALFGRPHHSRSGAWLWSSLVPATGCAILALLGALPSGLGDHHIRLTTNDCANLARLTQASDAFGVDQNNLQAVTLGWTNQANTYSSIGFASPTNLSN